MFFSIVHLQNDVHTVQCALNSAVVYNQQCREVQCVEVHCRDPEPRIEALVIDQQYNSVLSKFE